MVIQELLVEGINALEGIKYSNSQQEARLILSKLLGVDRSYIYAHGNQEVSTPIAEKFMDIIERRRDGYPLQYLLGYQEFMGLEFNVKSGVLIPRGDTELLVQKIIDFVELKLPGKHFRMLDIGIGSGAISLAVAKSLPQGEILGVDISDDALRVAEENRIKFEIENVEFLKSDLFSSLNKEIAHSFDIIASNPPYIPDEEILGLQKEVRLHEPLLALSGGEDGLDYYRIITAQAGNYLKKGGLLIYEIGADQGDSVSMIMAENGFSDVKISRDLEDRDRVVSGIL